MTNARDVLTQTAENSLDLAGPSSQKILLDTLRIFSPKLLPYIEDESSPGIFYPASAFEGGKLQGAGVVLGLDERFVVGWMKGFLQKPVTTELPVSQMTDIQTGIRPAGGRLSNPAASLTLTCAGRWELLFPNDQDGMAVRDVLAQMAEGVGAEQAVANVRA